MSPKAGRRTEACKPNAAGRPFPSICKHEPQANAHALEKLRKLCRRVHCRPDRPVDENR